MNDNPLLTEVFENHSNLIDLRAPIEFSAGSLPGAINLPIIDDDERANIGKTYKTKGKEAALSLGFKLVSGTKRKERISLWREYLSNNSTPLIFCYRGGKRSEIAQSWLRERGFTLIGSNAATKAYELNYFPFLRRSIALCY